MKSQANSEPVAGLQPTLAYTPPTSGKRSPKHALNLTTGSTPNYADEIARLLRSRLRAVAIGVGGATAASVAIGLGIGSPLADQAHIYQAHMRAVQVGSLVMYGG